MKPASVLETVLYAADLDAAERFYTGVLGLETFAKAPGRHVFFRLEGQMLLIFNADATAHPSPGGVTPMLPHGAHGAGHICFRASADEITDWRAHLEAQGIDIEADFEWPSGGRSIYFRDPAGNCLEFAEARIWGLAS